MAARGAHDNAAVEGHADAIEARKDRSAVAGRLSRVAWWEHKDAAAEGTWRKDKPTRDVGAAVEPLDDDGIRAAGVRVVVTIDGPRRTRDVAVVRDAERSHDHGAAASAAAAAVSARLHRNVLGPLCDARRASPGRVAASRHRQNGAVAAHACRCRRCM